MPREGRWGWNRSAHGLYIPIPAGTGAVSVMTALNPAFLQQLEKAYAVVAIAGTGAGATRVLNILRNAVVAATATVTLAGTATVGALIPLTVTDDGSANSWEDADTLSVDWPTAGAVAFTAGAINLYLVWRSRPQQR